MNSLSRISLNNINFKSKMPMPTPKPTPNNNDSQTIFIKPSIHNYEKPTGGHVPGEKPIDKIPEPTKYEPFPVPTPPNESDVDYWDEPVLFAHYELTQEAIDAGYPSYVYTTRRQQKAFMDDKINRETKPYCFDNVSITKNDLTTKNGLTLDKDGLPFSGEMKTCSARGGNVILTYENGLLKKSNEVFNNGTILEETRRYYDYDENNSPVSNRVHTTRSIYSINPETGKKEHHTTTIVNKTNQKTKNGTIETKEVTKEKDSTGQSFSFKTTSQMAILEDNTVVNLKIIKTNDKTTKTLTFRKPDGTTGEIAENGTIKRLTLPEENGRQVEIQLAEDEPGVVIKKIFKKDSVTTERWSSEIFPEIVSTFTHSSIDKHYFNSSKQRKDIYQIGGIHQTIRETDFYNTDEQFEGPHAILIQYSKDLKEKLEAAEKIVPFIS